MIETVKHSPFGLRYDDRLKKLKLRRISSTTFPSHYGRIELIDSKGDLIKTKEEKDDFFLITNIALPEDIAVPENLVVELGTFTCLDSRKNEKDNKQIIAIKDELKTFPDHKVMTELDNIKAFLITLRGSFKVTGFVAAPALPQPIKRLFNQVDWVNHSIWPSNFKDSLESGYSH